MRTDKLRIENLPPAKRVETELGETTAFAGAAPYLIHLHNDRFTKVTNA